MAGKSAGNVETNNDSMAVQRGQLRAQRIAVAVISSALAAGGGCRARVRQLERSHRLAVAGSGGGGDLGNGDAHARQLGRPVETLCQLDSAASPQARTSAIMLHTASSTSCEVSRLAARKAPNAVSKPGSLVFNRWGIGWRWPPPGRSI